ncbi:hypothetical protein MMC27_005641 [Xylographa pallens]|nr:hypothetical protein [Xylographa pallens]
MSKDPMTICVGATAGLVDWDNVDAVTSSELSVLVAALGQGDDPDPDAAVEVPEDVDADVVVAMLAAAAAAAGLKEVFWMQPAACWYHVNIREIIDA